MSSHSAMRLSTPANHSVSKVKGVSTANGLSIFIRSQWSDCLPVMLSNQPVVEAKINVSDLLEYCQALELAEECIEQQFAKPSPSIVKSKETLRNLRWKMEQLADSASEMHAAVVERMSQEVPELMPEYLSAFSAAVGQGDL